MLQQHVGCSIRTGGSSLLMFITRAVPGGGKLTQLITLAHTQPSPQAPADGEKREAQHAGGSSGCAACPEKQEAAHVRDPEPLWDLAVGRAGECQGLPGSSGQLCLSPQSNSCPCVMNEVLWVIHRPWVGRLQLRTPPRIMCAARSECCPKPPPFAHVFVSPREWAPPHAELPPAHLAFQHEPALHLLFFFSLKHSSRLSGLFH